MQQQNEYVIGLGGNLGEPRVHLARAVRACARLGRLLAVSALFETEPVGPPQPSFLNAAVRLSTTLEPEELLARLLEIEASEGRVRRVRWGPRTLDLDILWMPGRLHRSDVLVVPHPRLRERAFALVPLLEVAPDARDPLTGERYGDIARELDLSVVRRLERDWTGDERPVWGPHDL